MKPYSKNNQDRRVKRKKKQAQGCRFRTNDLWGKSRCLLGHSICSDCFGGYPNPRPCFKEKKQPTGV